MRSIQNDRRENTTSPLPISKKFPKQIAMINYFNLKNRKLCKKISFWVLTYIKKSAKMVTSECICEKKITIITKQNYFLRRSRMKNYKKLFICALSTLFVGAGIGGVSSLTTADAASLSYTEKTELENAPASQLSLEVAKNKGMTSYANYNVDGEDVWFFTSDGTKPGGKDPEIRFITPGTQTETKPYTFAPKTIEGFSFSYRLVNDAEAGVADLATSNYIVQVLASDGSYPIFTPEIVADGAWHTVNIGLNTPCSWAKASADDTEVNFDDVNELFAGFIFKAGNLDGELMISDIYYKEAKTKLNAAPASPIALEEAKVKNMTNMADKDYYYNVDGKDCWYFYGDGTATGNPEIRFVTEGTQTQSNPYTFAPVDVEQFSFEYRLVNDEPKTVADWAVDYILQVLASDGTYPIMTPKITADGEWHTITVDANTVIYNHDPDWNYRDISHLFSGFIFKMGGLDGELMIKNISVVVEGEEFPVEPEEPETPEDSGNNSAADTNSSNSSNEVNSSTNNGQSGAEDEPEASKGCGAAIGGTLTVGVLLAAGGLLLKRKED